MDDGKVIKYFSPEIAVPSGTPLWNPCGLTGPRRGLVAGY